MRFVDLTPDDIVREWPQRAAHFSDIADSLAGRFSVPDLLIYVRDGKYDAHGLRGADGSAPLTVLTSTVKYPQKTALVIFGLAGSGMRNWMQAATDGVHALARRNGATLIETRGRKGWERLFPGSRAKGLIFLEAEVA